MTFRNDRSIDQYKIEKIDRSTKELIVTSLVEEPLLTLEPLGPGRYEFSQI
jgi:hypothetical protein